MFASGRSGDADVYTMNPDGTGVTTLTNNAAYDTRPSFSYDGTNILFSSDRSGNFEIWEMNVDGSGATPLTNDLASDWRPMQSPDGTKIAFWSQRHPGNGEWNVYVMNADGTGVSNDLYPNSVQDYDPSWSPDGSKLTFWSGTGSTHEIFVMSPDGSGLTNLTNHPGDDGHPDFSPDGTQIVFFTSRNAGINQICLMPSTGGSTDCITTPVQGHNYEPSWQSAQPSTAIPVSIDVKPGSFPNSINVRNNGVIPVAILGTEAFNVTTVNALSVRFGPSSAAEVHGQGHLQDVNGDGRTDLVLHFSTRSTGIACGDLIAGLTGTTSGGQDIQGTDSVSIVGCQ